MKKIQKYWIIFPFLILLVLNLYAELPKSKVVIYPAPEGVPINKDFIVAVEKSSIPVYLARVSREDQRVKEISVPYYDTAGYAYFDMNEPVLVKVTYREKINEVKILPTSYGIKSKISGNSVSFKVPSPMNLTIEFNGDWVGSLHLFANPHEENVPDPKDPNVIYFGPGVHELGSLSIGDNKTLYIAGGAYIKALITPEELASGRKSYSPTFSLRGKNITVRGRGIIDGTLCPTRSRNMFMFRGCSDVEIEGIILHDGSPWFMPIRQSSNVHVDNIKMIGYRGNSDCIDIANCTDVLVEKCFLRSSDDLIVIKSDRNQGQVKHIVAKNCVLWNQFAHALSIGAELRENVDDVLFTDCDVIHDKGREWSLRVFHCDSSVISNIRFENIRVEDCRRLMSLWIGRSVWSLDKEKRGWIKDVTFKNITANGDPMTIAFTGADEKHDIKNVLFENVKINGRPIRKEDIEMKFTNNVNIKP